MLVIVVVQEYKCMLKIKKKNNYVKKIVVQICEVPIKLITVKISLGKEKLKKKIL